MKVKTKLALALSILFASPFVVFGLLACAMALRAFRSGDQPQAAMIVPGLLGIVFTGFGIGFIWRWLRAAKTLRRRAALEQQHPVAPWLWREDWASGRIQSNTKASMVFLWVFALCWNAITYTAMVLAWGELSQELFHKQNYIVLIAMLFPLVGLGLMAWAVRLTLQWKKYGTSVFEMATVPGVVGGRLRGIIHTNTNLRPAEGFPVTLTCIRRITTGSGKNQDTTERILWQDEQTVSPQLVLADDAGRGIPVAFEIPAECPETNDENPRDRILWRLQVTADVPGVDYQASFEVPVFHTRASPQTVSPSVEAMLSHWPKREQPYQPENSKIRLRPTLTGGTEFVFPALRTPGVALFLVVFLLLWNGFLALMIYKQAPLIFPLAFGFFDLLLVFSLLQLCLGTTRVVIESNAMRIRSSLLGLGRSRVIPLSQVADIRPKIGMQSGNTPYYNIEVVCRDGKEIQAGDNIKHKPEVEWIIDQMKKTIQAHTGVRLFEVR